MGELIRRERAAAPQGFSGERLTAAASGQVEIEHYHRYLLARDFCRGRDVLDIAAGEGYGTALLAQVARTAVGVEIDAATVEAACIAFQRPNLRYQQGDARAIPLPDASIDVAVSFETLEHLAEHDVFLAELHRVLRPDGLLIISTPDRDVYSAAGIPPNPFHVLELAREEFAALLRRHFAHAETVVQRSLIGSVILGAATAEPILSFEKRSDAVIEGSRHVARAPYLVAFASNAPLPAVPGSVYVHRGDLDTDGQVRFEAELAAREADQRTAAAVAQAAIAATAVDVAHRAEVGRLSVALSQGAAALDAQRASAETERLRLDQAAEALRHAQAHIGAIEASFAWRATGPLRRAARRHPGLARMVRRAAKLVWYAATLQLLRRYRLWRQHRAAPPAPGGTMAGPATPGPVTAEQRTPIDPAAIRLPAPVAAPDVTIIIATYGQLQATLACLRSIADHPPRAGIEVVLVDDAYPGPEDMAGLQGVIGLVILRNPVNLGFLRSCNHAARSARGRYIHLLNNDAELRPGAVDALVDLLDARPEAGLAGSKLIYPDGVLQEAGGILWDDASGWNYGKHQDAARPEYNYVRAVDFCSGASIMVRRTLWEAQDGFDDAFAPAYYEDADLAFRVRAAGFTTLYEPASVVVHHEGLSHGTDTAVGVKAHQVTNQARMASKWADTLAREHYPSGQCILRARDRGRGRKTILVIDHYTPEPDRDAGSRSTLGILTSLADAGWVVKLWPHNRTYSAVYAPPLERLGIEVIDQRSAIGLAEWLHENGAATDHIMVMRPDIAVDVLPTLMRGADAVLSFYGVDLHFARIRRQAALDGNPALFAEAARMERIERRVWRPFDVVIYPSEEEADAVRAMAPSTLVRGIVPFTFDASPRRDAAPDAARTILFVAGFAHPPNVDAAMFLMTAVVPLLIASVGPLKVILAGSNPTDAVRALAGPDVAVTGYLSDEALGGLYATCRAAVVPLRFGAGVKGKVVEALCRGLPVVTTGIGAQGIPGLAEIVPVLEDASAIARALAVLVTDDAAWLAQSHRQTEFAERRFSRAAMQRSVLDALAAGEAAASR